VRRTINILIENLKIFLRGKKKLKVRESIKTVYVFIII
jgi:hypothetical protein